MNKILVSLGIKYLANRFDGKKAYVGAAGEILTGIGSLIAGLVGLISYAYPDLGLTPEIDVEVSLAALTGGFYMISAGVKGIGIRHGIEKITAESRGEGNV